ncbi:trypsin domain-containing protein [Phthorimaea operculella]|nr:trypsin domain-containing protein [Phthorimaea operculella]
MWGCSVLLFTLIYFVRANGEYHANVVNPDLAERRTPATRIVGGQPTTIEQWPFMVQVLRNLSPVCAGSILTSRHVLSAAHCFVNSENKLLPVSVFAIRAGSTSLWTGGTVVAVQEIITHADYNTRIVRDNDVAVLLLQNELTFSSSIQSAGIPQAGYTVPDDAHVTYIGWGTTESGAVSTTLREVWVRKVNNEECVERYRMLEAQNNMPWPVTSSMICAGLLDVGGKDACSGDSGGPLVYNGAVVGVISWGWNCAEAQYPGVNARVSNFTFWIADTVIQLSPNATDPQTTTRAPGDDINIVEPDVEDKGNIELPQINNAVASEASLFCLVLLTFGALANNRNVLS